MGLEAIIRKALMGKYDEQWEERSPLSANAFNSLNASASLPAAMPITPADGRNEDVRSLPGLQPSPPSLSVINSQPFISPFTGGFIPPLPVFVHFGFLFSPPSPSFELCGSAD